VQPAVTSLRAIVDVLCPVLADETYAQMWEDYQPSVSHLDEREGRIRWAQDTLRHPVVLPSRFLSGFSIANIVDSTRDKLAINPTMSMSAEQSRALRLERLFVRVYRERSHYPVTQIHRAVRTIVDMEGGILTRHFLGFNRRSQHATFLLLHFVKAHSSMQRFEQARLAESVFEPLLSRTLDEFDINSRLRDSMESDTGSRSRDDFRIDDTDSVSWVPSRYHLPAPCGGDDDIDDDCIHNDDYDDLSD